MVDIKRFVPLGDGIDNPMGDGHKKGSYEGHGPWAGRMGMADLIPRHNDPPVSFRTGRNWVGVSYYVEKSRSGSLHHIVCFACDLTWSGEWSHFQIYKDIRQAEPDPRMSYVGPVMEGSGFVHSGSGERTCTCVHGMTKMTGGLLLVATNDEIRTALRDDAELARKGMDLMDPGKQLREMVARAESNILKTKSAMETELGEMDPED